MQGMKENFKNKKNLILTDLKKQLFESNSKVAII